MGRNELSANAIAASTHRALRRAEQRCEAERCETSLSRASAASGRIGATFPQCQAVRIVIRHPFKPAPHPQHHRRLALSDDLAHDQNPAAVVGTRVASSASVRTEKRAVDRRIVGR